MLEHAGTEEPKQNRDTVIFRDYVEEEKIAELKEELESVEAYDISYYIDEAPVTFNGKGIPEIVSPRLWWVFGSNNKKAAKEWAPKFKEICSKYSNNHTKRK